MAIVESSHNRVPACVMALLARLDQAGRNLADDRPEGPYALEALLEDVRLCPSIGSAPIAAGAAELASRLSAARDAAKVVHSCPVSKRDFANERLRAAIAAAREVVTQRVEDAETSGDRSALFGPRCTACTFA